MITADGKEWSDSEFVLVGCVNRVRSRDLIIPPQVGKFPVLIDKKTTQMFVYSKKITNLGE